MPDLRFQVEKAEAEAFAVAPLLVFKLRVSAGADPVPIHTVVLRCQVRIDPAQRRYETHERDQLLDLFDTPDRWGQTLRSMLWVHTSVVVPAFTESVVVDLPVPCTFDFNVAATKYFSALEDGEVPLSLLFSGTIFYEREDVGLQVGQVNWNAEASFRLPVQVWRDMMKMYYPNIAWLCLRRDVFDRLCQYKSQNALPTWEQTIEHLLPAPIGQGKS